MERTQVTRGRTYRTLADGTLAVRAVRVRVVSGPDLGREATLEEESMLFGSGEGADVALTDGSVSPVHLELAMVEGRVRVRDLESTNGTFVGAVQVQSVLLAPPAEVRIGRTSLELTHVDLPTRDLPSANTAFGRVLGQGLPMRRIFAVLEAVQDGDVPLLLEGPAGAGKTACVEHIAKGRPVHALDFRGPIDLEAARRAWGSGALAALDHVELVSPEKVSSLEALLERTAARIVATTRRDLRELVRIGAFSRDLFFAIAAVHVRLPPLRERPDDMFPLALQAATDLGAPTWRPSARWLAEQRADPLEGNVRELRHRVALALGETSDVPIDPAPEFKERRQQVIDTFERAYLVDLLHKHAFNISEAARDAGLSRNHLTTLCKRHGLS